MSASPSATTPPTGPTVVELRREFPMQTSFVLLVVVVIVGVLLGGFVLAPTPPGSGSSTGNLATAAATGTAVLAIVGGAAVVIERVLEAFWSVVDSTTGGWWPFYLVHDKINDWLANFAALVTPYVTNLNNASQKLQTLAGNEAELKAKADAALQATSALSGNLTALAMEVRNTKLGNDQKLQYLLTESASRINSVLIAHPDLGQHLDSRIDLATSLTNDVNSFLTTFQDNPPRRMISLVVGCLLGYAIALVLRLDMFLALGVPLTLGTGSVVWSAGVPLTGLVMGLGSNPTHELIQAIQQYKQQATSGPGSTTTTSTTTAVPGT
ncbi:MAG: hypothetical protein JO057_22890 [Chloroflexi bacterium]|nr:hypothetical protein [Chloroflexota bacterium]